MLIESTGKGCGCTLLGLDGDCNAVTVQTRGDVVATFWCCNCHCACVLQDEGMSVLQVRLLTHVHLRDVFEFSFFLSASPVSVRPLG